VLLVVIAWWLLAASRRTKIERTGEPPSDSLPARRNEALIDAPTTAIDAVDIPPPTPESLAGAGAAVAAAAAPVHEPVHHDDLKRIKGVGPKLEALLRSLGVTSYSQIAAWDDDEIDRIDARLGTFAGRIRRDDWKTQAGYLASGDMAGFEQRFGRV
jgi:predicted flap endonuclease-1-like 5' DNA nuclease